jgi:putative SOS response-associated peptidase YedK
MCGRFSNRYTWSELHDLYRAFLDSTEADWTPKFNIAPTTQIPVLRYVDGRRRFDLMRWGLVPAWSKGIGSFSTFNARSDGVERKAAYRGAWKAGRRCIIPGSSFFEWQKIDARSKQRSG